MNFLCDCFPAILDNALLAILIFITMTLNNNRGELVGRNYWQDSLVKSDRDKVRFWENPKKLRCSFEQMTARGQRRYSKLFGFTQEWTLSLSMLTLTQLRRKISVKFCHSWEFLQISKAKIHSNILASCLTCSKTIVLRKNIFAYVKLKEAGLRLYSFHEDFMRNWAQLDQKVIIDQPPENTMANFRPV